MPGTLSEPHIESPLGPNFGLELARPDRLGQWTRAGIGSLLIHFLLGIAAVGVGQLPGPGPRTAPAIRIERIPQVTKLIAPPLDVMTQRAPNKNKISQEFNAASLAPRPAQQNVPATPGAAAAPRQQFRMPGQRTPDGPKAALPDVPAPAIDLSRAAAPPPALGVPNVPPPPQIEPQEKPKLAFERPGLNSGISSQQNGLGRTNVPKAGTTVEEAARQVARGGGRGLIVGDEDAASAPANPSSPSVPIPGKLGSAVELMSDPQGVDFWPYLVKILTTVRRNWFAVTPESARFGRQGRTVIQFAINRDGSVPKLVIAVPAGAEALDRAAVAAISASNPFIPLPAEFKGSQIRLQFVFKYNLK